MNEANLAARFETLNQQGHAAAEAGLLDVALNRFEQLTAVADESGEERLQDLAFCNRAALAVLTNASLPEVPRLREILMRNRDSVNARLAAYNLSRHFEVTKSFKKAMFYARIASQRSYEIGRPDWIASGHNQLGNVLLAECFVEAAVTEYEKALAVMPKEAPVGLALVFANLGYCRLLQHRHSDGFALLFKSLRMLRSKGAERYLLSPLLDLCYAYLEIERYDRARRYGEQALVIAERCGDVETIKNALYLLGEAANLGGHEVTARSYFGRLQNDYFPQADYLTPMLLAVNVRKLVHLHA